MKVLLLEDEPMVAQSLIKTLLALEPSAQIEGPVATVVAARERLSSDSFDLILSDIQLADGISLDIFTGGNIACPIIFTTAYNEYAIRAFKVNSIDYLLKPVDKTELKSALDKFHFLRQKFGNETYLRQIAGLFENFQNSKRFKERFTVHSGRNLLLISVVEVAAFTKDEIIFLLDNDGRKFITDYRSLDEIEELIDPAVFFRANRQFIIQLPFIESIRSEESGKILLKMKTPALPEIVISKEKAAAFRRWLEQ